MTDTITAPAPRFRPRISPTTSKLVCLALLGLAAMLPNTMVTSLVDERQANEQEAQNAVAKSWGPAQTITAPSLMLVTKTPTSSEGHPSISYLRIKPTTLDVETEIVPERPARLLRNHGLHRDAAYEGNVRRP